MLKLWKWIKVSGSMSINAALLLGFEEGKWKNFKGYGFQPLPPGPITGHEKQYEGSRLQIYLNFKLAAADSTPGCIKLQKAAQASARTSVFWVSIIPEVSGPLLFMPRNLQRHHKCISELHMNKKKPTLAVCVSTAFNAAECCNNYQHGRIWFTPHPNTHRCQKTVPKLRNTNKKKNRYGDFGWKSKSRPDFSHSSCRFITQLPKEKILEILKINAKMTTRQIINLLSAVNLLQNMAEATSVVGEKTLAIKPWFMVSI